MLERSPRRVRKSRTIGLLARSFRQGEGYTLGESMGCLLLLSTPLIYFQAKYTNAGGKFSSTGTVRIRENLVLIFLWSNKEYWN